LSSRAKQDHSRSEGSGKVEGPAVCLRRH